MAEILPSSSESTPITYNGDCHCGHVKFTVKKKTPIESGPVTNCNYDDFKWVSGGDDLTGYTFGKERIVHWFCPTCGTNVRSTPKDPAFFKGKFAVNVRVLDGIDLDALDYKKFDGKSL